jgi:hypothetical protein
MGLVASYVPNAEPITAMAKRSCGGRTHSLGGVEPAHTIGRGEYVTRQCHCELLRGSTMETTLPRLTALSK